MSDHDHDHDPLVRLEDDFEADTVHHPYSAFNQGFDAGEQGIPASLNPYPDGSTEEWWWDEGHSYGEGSATT